MSQQVCAACGGPVAGQRTVFMASELQHLDAADCVGFCRRPGFSRSPAAPGSSLRRVTITLEEEEYDTLLIALERATNEADHDGANSLLSAFRRLRKAIEAEYAP